MTRARLQFCARKLFLCRHLVKSSDCLFNFLSLFDFNMVSFSWRQRLQLFPRVYMKEQELAWWLTTWWYKVSFPCVDPDPSTLTGLFCINKHFVAVSKPCVTKHLRIFFVFHSPHVSESTIRIPLYDAWVIYWQPSPRLSRCMGWTRLIYWACVNKRGLLIFTSSFT